MCEPFTEFRRLHQAGFIANAPYLRSNCLASLDESRRRLEFSDLRSWIMDEAAFRENCSVSRAPRGLDPMFCVIVRKYDWQVRKFHGVLEQHPLLQAGGAGAPIELDDGLGFGGLHCGPVHSYEPFKFAPASLFGNVLDRDQDAASFMGRCPVRQRPSVADIHLVVSIGLHLDLVIAEGDAMDFQAVRAADRVLIVVGHTGSKLVEDDVGSC